MRKNSIFKNLLAYFLISVVSLGTIFYSNLFIEYDLDGYYGKLIDRPAYNFSLYSTQKKEVRLSDFKGKFVLLTFGFSRCQTVCPLNLSKFRSLWHQLQKENAQKLEFAFLSFDQLRDHPKDVELFLKEFNIKNLHGLVDGKEQVLNVAREYLNHISYSKELIKFNPETQVQHNGYLYLIDDQGKLAMVYPQKKLQVKELMKDIIKLASR